MDTDVQLLSLMHRTQAKIFRSEQKAILALLTRQRRQDPEYQLSESEAEKLGRINTFLSKATQSVLDLDEAREKLRGQTETDVLVAQLRHEFVLAAKSYTEDELTLLARHLPEESWAVLERERQKGKQ